jgi:hypothetical protein
MGEKKLNRYTKAIKMEKVLFISVESGDDLIVSFVTPGDGFFEGDGGSVKSLILQRTPKYERFLFPEERGVKVSYEDDDDDDRRDRGLLKEILFSDTEVKIVASRKTYELNIVNVDEAEVVEAKSVLKTMNRDQAFKLKIV